jgi:alkanesulfonate monooxygenase SsuD/methylene tetrahydromethanopterin reductase-like flavin-dependent oxidoreductase (luciferase family)
MAAVDRPAGEIEITVGVCVLPDPGADSQYGRAIVGDPERVAERLRAYAEAGADLVIVSLAPAPFAELDPSYPDKMAEVLRYL